MSKYYTKCGRPFTKSVNADTTGYFIAENESGEITDDLCRRCPFVIDVKDGWGDNITHKRFECRAGNQRPNHKDTYSGSSNDKTTLRLYSLNHEFCESVIAFAQNHPDLGAAYNQDCSDCRRTISISCSQNRKGMVAKQELIDKFFPTEVKMPEPDDSYSTSDTCAGCGYNYSGNCSAEEKPKPVKDTDVACANWIPAEQPDLSSERVEDIEDIEQEETNHMTEIVKPIENSIFNYSGLDDKTRDALKAVEGEIAKIKMQTVYDIGNYLSIAHEALAKAGSGTFGEWCESIGFSRQSAQNYMQAYDFICQNFDRPEKAIGIQASLLFAASKPSAPSELTQAVIDGDITQHKDYQAALAKLKEAEENANCWRQGLDNQKAIARDAKKLMVEENTERRKAEEELKVIKQQLEQSKRNADPKKLKELSGIISDLQEQLKAKPLEVSAVEIREVVPEHLSKYISSNVRNAMEVLCGLSAQELDLIIASVGSESYHYMKSEYRVLISRSINTLKALDETIVAAPAADEFIRRMEGNR